MDTYEPKEHSPNSRDVIYSWSLAIIASFVVLLVAQVGGL
jgi:hypothetical protein